MTNCPTCGDPFDLTDPIQLAAFVAHTAAHAHHARGHATTTVPDLSGCKTKAEIIHRLGSHNLLLDESTYVETSQPWIGEGPTLVVPTTGTTRNVNDKILVHLNCKPENASTTGGGGTPPLTPPPPVLPHGTVPQPPVTGLNLKEADKQFPVGFRIQEPDLEPDLYIVKRYHPTVLEGRIISQSPATGGPIYPSDTRDPNRRYEVSLGKKPKPGLIEKLW